MPAPALSMPTRCPLHRIAALLVVGCRLHGVEALPPSDDPGSPQAAAVPWNGLPDHLDGEVYGGPGSATSVHHHHHESDAEDHSGHGTNQGRVDKTHPPETEPAKDTDVSPAPVPSDPAEAKAHHHHHPGRTGNDKAP